MTAARLLDLTRSVSRLGRGPFTGIDRVEAAWAAELAGGDAPAFALIRSAAGFLLLDRAGMRALFTTPLPARGDLISRLGWRGDPLHARAETLARRLAVARCTRRGLVRLLRRRLPAGGEYLNVGHANLSDRLLAAVREAGLRITVLVHDTIPLDHPEFARPDTLAPARARLAAVSALADRVVHLTGDARRRTEAQMARLGRVPPGLVAPLGITPPLPDPALLPPGLDLAAPFFVALGTIEPRKNLDLLLDVWEMLPPPLPRLYLAGARGWAGAGLLARLDALPPGGAVRELPGLPDGAVAALLHEARALLFPSMAEGFGLPPLEAAALGTPVLATDLPVIRELLGDYPVYLQAADRYSWRDKIMELAQKPDETGLRMKRVSLPRWEGHFKRVLSP